MAESSPLQGWTSEPSASWPLEFFDVDLSPHHARQSGGTGRMKGRRAHPNGHSPGHDSRLNRQSTASHHRTVRVSGSNSRRHPLPGAARSTPGRGVSGTRGLDHRHDAGLDRLGQARAMLRPRRQGRGLGRCPDRADSGLRFPCTATEGGGFRNWSQDWDLWNRLPGFEDRAEHQPLTRSPLWASFYRP